MSSGDSGVGQVVLMRGPGLTGVACAESCFKSHSNGLEGPRSSQKSLRSTGLFLVHRKPRHVSQDEDLQENVDAVL